MKKMQYLAIALPLLMIACQKDPIATFHIDSNEPEVGHEVLFINDSHNANSFEWDFGDGFVSGERNPTHIFTGTGTYDITLKAISKKGTEDNASLTINVMIPTLLEIEVREYYQEYIVPYASVILYPTLSDWDAQTNLASQGLTDATGKVVFSTLDPYVYYVDVWEDNHDNYTLAGEDVGFIRTPEIIPHEINRFVAWVDVASHSKGFARGSRQLVIKKIERKAVDKKQPADNASSETWLDLYKRSVPGKL